MTEQTTTNLGPSTPVANPFSWCDIEVTDLARAEAFYGEVFGWEFVPFGDDFRMATTDGALVCGLMKADGAVAGRGLRGYIATDPSRPRCGGSRPLVGRWRRPDRRSAVTSAGGHCSATRAASPWAWRRTSPRPEFGA
ncbi:MAG: hypothetical protein ACRDPQ_19970 [Nocardioidaceae bacterium]